MLQVSCKITASDIVQYLHHLAGLACMFLGKSVRKFMQLIRYLQDNYKSGTILASTVCASMVIILAVCHLYRYILVLVPLLVPILIHVHTYMSVHTCPYITYIHVIHFYTHTTHTCLSSIPVPVPPHILLPVLYLYSY